MRNTRDALPIYTEKELTAIFTVIQILEQDPEWQTRCFFARMLLGTGLRINEAINVRLGDCLPKTIEIHHAKRGPNGQEKPREVDVSPEFRPHYTAWTDAMKERNRKTVQPLFISPFQGLARKNKRPLAPITVRTGRNWWREIIEQAGVRYLSPHAARRTYATFEEKAKRMNRSDLKAQLGHSGFAIMDKHYIISVPGQRYDGPDMGWCEVAMKMV